VKLVLALLPVLALLGCGRDPFMPPIAPSGTRPPDPDAVYRPLPSPRPARVDSVREVRVGDRVEGIVGTGMDHAPGEHHVYVTVPAGGILEATLQWDPSKSGTILMLGSDERVFTPTPPLWSPVVARIPVGAAGRYLIVIRLASHGGDDWPHQPYLLTTRLEP
jgi:hypothetical protein